MICLVIASLLCITVQTVQPVPIIAQPLLPRADIAVAETPPTPATMSDTDALKAVKIDPNDSEALLDYIRLRTLNDIDLSAITNVIAELGDEDFDRRLAAQQRLVQFGLAASGPLRSAIATSTDPEIAYRARKCLEELEQLPHERVALAVVRRLAETRPPNTAQVLLDYLPLVSNRTIQTQINNTLAVIARSEKTPAPALIKALDAKFSVTRLAAALALIQRDLLKDQPALQKQLMESAQKEDESSIQFQMLFALAHETSDPTAIDAILRLLPNLPRGRLWQAEDLLLQLAGDQAPKATFGMTKQEIQQAASIWQRWWQEQKQRIDLTKFVYKPRTTGRMLLSLISNSAGPASLMELDPDLEIAWELEPTTTPSDVISLPDGTIAVAEPQESRVTIQNTQGEVLRVMTTIAGQGRQRGSPQKLQLLDNENILVICRNEVLEFKKGTDDVVMSYFAPTHNIASALRLPNGETLVVFQQGTATSVFLDKEGKEIKDRKLNNENKPFYQADLCLAGNDHVLLTELNRLAEYDIKTGDVVWQINASRPTSVQRLLNGNTLYVAGSNGVIELDPDGKTVWTYQSNKKIIHRARRQ